MKILSILLLAVLVNLNQLQAAEAPNQEDQKEYTDFDIEALEAYLNSESEVSYLSPVKPMTNPENKSFEELKRESVTSMKQLRRLAIARKKRIVKL